MVEELTYKNKPILKLTGEGYTKLYIGLKKARLILEPENLEAIRAFVASHTDKDNISNV